MYAVGCRVVTSGSGADGRHTPDIGLAKVYTSCWSGQVATQTRDDVLSASKTIALTLTLILTLTLTLLQVCDGVSDCAAGEDEAPSLCSGRGCGGGRVRCGGSHACIHPTMLCSGGYLLTILLADILTICLTAVCSAAAGAALDIFSNYLTAAEQL